MGPPQTPTRHKLVLADGTGIVRRVYEAVFLTPHTTFGDSS